MASHNENPVTSSPPAPGAYPESIAKKRTPSVASTSVEVQNDIRELLSTQQFENCTWKGNPAWVMPKSKWNDIQAKLDRALTNNKSTVGVAELSELQRELSSLRLKCNAFESEKERFEFATTNLKKALDTAKKNEEDAKAESARTFKELQTASAGLKASLQAATQMRKEFEDAIKKARKEGPTEDVEKLLTDKRRLSEEITTLNNALQQVNTDRKSVESRLKRFERQSLELTNELNLEKSRYSISNPAPGQTFADKARLAGSATFDLYNAAASNLSTLAKERFSKISSIPIEDEKNTVFWLKATFDASKHAVYRPYKLIFDGLGNDIRSMSIRSRKLFDPLLIAVRDSLLPTGRPLTLSEMEDMMAGINLNDIELNAAYRKKGYRTAGDLQDLGLTIGLPDASDVPPRSEAIAKGKRPVTPDDSAKSEKLTLQHPDLRPSDDDEPSPKGKPKANRGEQKSFYSSVKDWFSINFGKMNRRVKRALRRSPARSKRYLSLSHGGWLKRFFLVPYSWYLWAFP